MTDLDLRRKTLEACGWEWACPPIGDDPTICRHGKSAEVETAPACESDDGIALKMLREFCEKRQVHWEIGSDMEHAGNFTCLIAALDAETCANSIARAICLALSAKEKL